MPKDVYYKINEAKQIKLVRSALTAFTKDSYENLTVSDITKTMDILRTDFYYYFKDKADVFEAVKEFLVSTISFMGEPKDALSAVDYLVSYIFSLKKTKNRQFYLTISSEYNPNSVYTFKDFFVEKYGIAKKQDEYKLVAKIHLALALTLAVYTSKLERTEALEILASQK